MAIPSGRKGRTAGHRRRLAGAGTSLWDGSLYFVFHYSLPPEQIQEGAETQTLDSGAFVVRYKNMRKKTETKGGREMHIPTSQTQELEILTFEQAPVPDPMGF